MEKYRDQAEPVLFSLLTAIFWTCSAYSGSRVARVISGPPANGLRISSALALWLIALIFIPSVPLPTLRAALIFLLAGFLHMGLGDNYLYRSYASIGPRLGALLCITSSTFFALVLEKISLGGLPSVRQLMAMAIMLSGTTLALAPKERLRLGSDVVRLGLRVALMAGAFQAVGAVLSRFAFDCAQLPEGLNSSVMPTILRVGGAFLGLLILGRLSIPRWWEQLKEVPRGRWWLASSTILGPGIGILVYQSALRHTNSGMVQAVVGTMPLLMIPVTWIFDGDRPSGRSMLGALLAIIGLVMLVRG